MKKIRNSVQSKTTARRRYDATPTEDGASGPPQATNAKSTTKDDSLPRPRSLEIEEKRQPRAVSPAATAGVLEDLRGALGRVTAVNHPRTFKFLRSGNRKLARKLIEEACEVTVEAVKRNKPGIVLESADLLYHLVLLWFRSGVEPLQIWQEMQRRADTLGIAEKLPKCPLVESLPTNLRH